MSNHIHKDDPNRWFIVQNNATGEESLIVFGHAGDQGVNELVTGEPILLDYLTEDEVEIKVNDIAGIANYYKDAVETGNSKFQLPSGKYSSPEE
tara:strand:- start:15 stop:296 length:282 start_codon:yes stop_codon:yes gene_type:complete